MASGKAVNLRVRPVQSVDLSFPVDGLIGFLPEGTLGSPAKGYPIASFYDHLSAVHTEPGRRHGRADAVLVETTGRLAWDSETIRESLLPYTLCALRAAPNAVDVDNAIGFRQNTYLTSYSPDVLAKVSQVFYEDPADEEAALWKLVVQLEADSMYVNAVLNNAYKAAGRYGQVVTKTETNTDAVSTSKTPDGSIATNGQSRSFSEGYDYRQPSAENDMRTRRARANLRPEFLRAWRMAEMCRHGDITFKNELDAIDRQIKKLQIAFIDTLLIPAFDGVVTGVFRGSGDYVRAGEPVLRVEDDNEIYLVGTVKYRGMLRVGSTAKIEAVLFDVPGGQAASVDAAVVAVRGHDSVSEQWDVIFQAHNETSKGTKLPLNYNFEFDSTKIDVIA